MINGTNGKWNSAIMSQERRATVDKRKQEKLQNDLKSKIPTGQKKGRNIILLNNPNWNQKQEPKQ
jgi:hypothetical protein